MWAVGTPAPPTPEEQEGLGFRRGDDPSPGISPGGAALRSGPIQDTLIAPVSGRRSF
jgi:hypothetical protein